MENETSAGNYQSVADFGESYGKIHPYIAIIICLFSVGTNVINSVVLSSRELRSATNTLLLSIAVCHLFLNIFYLGSSVHDLVPQSIYCDSHIYTFEWVMTILLFSHVSFTLHALGTWFTVALAVVRCIQLKTRDNRYANPLVAVKIIAIVTLVVLFLCIPNYMAFSVNRVSEENNPLLCIIPNSHVRMTEGWLIGASQISSNLNGRPFQIAFELSAVLFYLMPCCFLIVAFCYLLSTLSDFGKRRKHLGMTTMSRCVHVEHHTMMLLLVLAMFVTTQLPQGILTLLCSTLSESYRLNVYQSLGQVMELLSIVNGLVGFILYCAMSSLFRSTFVNLFRESRKKPICRYPRPSVDNVKLAECHECLSRHRSRCTSTCEDQRASVCNVEERKPLRDFHSEL